MVEAFAGWALDEILDASESAIKYIKEAWDDWDQAQEAPQNVFATYDSLSDPMGTVQGGVVDCGDPDALDLPRPTGDVPPEELTLVRVDDVRLCQGECTMGHVVYSSHAHSWRQYYSDDTVDGWIRIPVYLEEALEKENGLIVRIYLRVMRGDRSGGPLALVNTDRLYLEWRLIDGKLHFYGLMPNPVDYPSFDY